VRGRQYEAAAREVIAHEPGELRLRGCVERGRRLVEQPERPLAGSRAMPASPTASSAAAQSSLPPRKRDQKARFSVTESDGLSASRWPR